MFFHSFSQPFTDLAPVNYLPHLFQEDWTGILVVNVVGMFPDIHVEDRDQVQISVSDQILVCSGVELESMLLFVVD